MISNSAKRAQEILTENIDEIKLIKSIKNQAKCDIVNKKIIQE